MSRITFHNVRIKTVATGVPAFFEFVLPAHVRKVVGILALHTIGMENTIGLLPASNARLGWMHIEFNNRGASLGNFDVYRNEEDATYDYQETSVEVDKGKLVTGFYYHEAEVVSLPAGIGVLAGSFVTPGIIFSVYLKCESE